MREMREDERENTKKKTHTLALPNVSVLHVMASNGGEWWMASMVSVDSLASMAQEGTDVEVPLVPMVVASCGVERWLGSYDTRGH